MTGATPAGRVGLTAAVAAALAVFVTIALRLDFLSDDAFISFRYAANLAAGDGLVFNPGERVEGYTSFSMVMLLAALHRAGLDLVFAGRAVSLLGGVAALVAVYLLVRRLVPERPRAALAAVSLLGVNQYVAAWSRAGLETTLYAALLAALALMSAGRFSSSRFVASSLVSFLLSLTRPEGVVVYAVLLAATFAVLPGRWAARVRALGPGLAAFTVLGGVYMAARYGYFGELLPNTYYAKAGFTPRHVVRGLRYLWEFFVNPFVLVQAPLLAAGLVSSLRRRVLLPPLLLVALLGMVVTEGGDGLPMYRFLVPAIPLMTVLVALGLEKALSRGPRWAGLGLASFLAAVALSFHPNGDTQYRMFINQRNSEIPRWSLVGKALAEAFPGRTVIAAVPIGAVAYYSRLPAIDLVGLTDKVIARSVVPGLGSGRAGHEKYNSAYVLERRPDLLLLGNIFVTDKPSFPKGIPLSSPIAAEKDLVAQPGFSSRYTRAALPLGNGHYLHLYVAKGSPKPGR